MSGRSIPVGPAARSAPESPKSPKSASGSASPVLAVSGRVHRGLSNSSSGGKWVPSPAHFFVSLFNRASSPQKPQNSKAVLQVFALAEIRRPMLWGK